MLETWPSSPEATGTSSPPTVRATPLYSLLYPSFLPLLRWQQQRHEEDYSAPRPSLSKCSSPERNTTVILESESRQQ
jgi:hypothetical protein